MSPKMYLVVIRQLPEGGKKGNPNVKTSTEIEVERRPNDILITRMGDLRRSVIRA